jgi:hypothetical protein
VLRWRHTTASPISSEFIIYSGKTRRWSNSSRGWRHHIVVLGNRRNLQALLSEHRHLRKKQLCYILPLPSSAAWGHAKLSLQFIEPNYAYSLLQLRPCQTQPEDYMTQLCLCQVLIGLPSSLDIALDNV